MTSEKTSEKKKKYIRLAVKIGLLIVGTFAAEQLELFQLLARLIAPEI